MNIAEMSYSKIIVITGHYGCGKTNLALNMAADFSKAGERVTLVDLDIVNPYFRSSDYQPLLDELGIELIAPTFAHSNVDLPALPAAMGSIFTREGRIIVDVGGDDAGAVALGRYARQFSESEYCMLYVVNQYRVLSQTVSETVELLREIETASRLKADMVVNNSHIMEHTVAKDIFESQAYAQRVAEELGLPLAFTAAERRFAAELENKVNNLYPVDVLVTKPW